MSEMKKDIDWKALVVGAKKGDAKAGSELIGKAHKPLFVYCLHLSKNRQLAEDLTHDALLKALGQLGQLREAEAFLGWVKTIARSLFLDHVKSAAQSKAHLGYDEIEERELSQDPSISVEQIHAMRVLQGLSEENRSILILIDIQECSYKEASQVLEIPEGTVKSRLFRAREKFAVLFDGTNQGPHSSEKVRRV